MAVPLNPEAKVVCSVPSGGDKSVNHGCLHPDIEQPQLWRRAQVEPEPAYQSGSDAAGRRAFSLAWQITDLSARRPGTGSATVTSMKAAAGSGTSSAQIRCV
jgi:hypothetical protein